ncbi:uncharacterized protein LOC114362985 [Ostrinia furnacalis]|uniref:uncharacterized protein LOC114362985 n=1 Tax=Ostrinia furnacalis TaxID=93504 RepID=UPI001038F2DD|nr:uncharacterized protein LOC114362985 [Ostrinia furnacalis]
MGLHQGVHLQCIRPPRPATKYAEQFQNQPQSPPSYLPYDALREICQTLVNIFMTARGKERLIYHNYTYYKQQRTRSGFRWGCTKNRWHKCKAYLHLADDMTIVRCNLNHTHSAFSST